MNISRVAALLLVMNLCGCGVSQTAHDRAGESTRHTTNRPITESQTPSANPGTGTSTVGTSGTGTANPNPAETGAAQTEDRAGKSGPATGSSESGVTGGTPDHP